ncbi:MAG: sensor histidine kinase, partial [Longimicrobiales bacterium]
DLALAPCSIGELCESSVRMVRSEFGKKHLEFTLQDQSSQGSIVVDYRRLQQALVSLLSNAIKFTPEGGEFGLSVFQTGDGEDKFLSLQVWDKGIGIPEAEIENLFVPFQQLDGGLARQHSGTGLGLVIAKRMVELHGGTLHLDSVEGEGTRVTITLPLVPASTASLQLSQGE